MKYTFRPWHLLIYIWIILNIVLCFKGGTSCILCKEDTELITVLKMVDICWAIIIGLFTIIFLLDSDYTINITLWKTKKEKEEKRRKIARENLLENIDILDSLIRKEDDPIELKRFINQKEKLTNMLKSI